MNYTPLIEAVISGEFIRATKYLHSVNENGRDVHTVVRATRIQFARKQPKANGEISIRLTVGEPNYLEREFIKTCIKAGEPFPIKKIQLKPYRAPKQKLERKKK